MLRAFEEARRGVGRTAPNPPVGAVVVKEGVELGAGWHRQAGKPHAEREAMAAVREAHGPDALRGATVYVTLEPCSTRGRTPACTEGLIEAGVARVVWAATDPNPAHAGRAESVLGAAGIEVRAGVLAAEGERLIRPFAKVQRTGLPWVLWKTAMSLDGRLTRPPGEGMWLTGSEARAEVQRLRAEVDAIVTSGETVRRDRPRLDLRDAALLEGRAMPWRVILTDRPETLPADAPLLADAHRERTLVLPRRDPKAALQRLVAERGVCAVMLEAGGRLAGEFFDAGLIDEVAAFLAPALTGGEITSLGGNGTAGWMVEEAVFARFGPDLMARGILKRPPDTKSAAVR